MNPSDSATQPGIEKQKIICGSHECREPAVLTLEARALCLDHLVSYCYSRLQECEQGDDGKQTQLRVEPESATARAFLDQCRGSVASLLIVRTDLSNIERARLLDIILWASEIIEKCRRSAPVRRLQSAAGIQFD